MDMQIGQMITDGTVTWIVDDARDGHRPGNIILDHILRPGYVKANGAVLQAADYPRLIRFVIENNLSVTEAEWQADKSGLYVYDETAGTLRVPDLRGEFMRGLDDGRGIDTGRVLGISQGDAIRNITGRVDNDYGGNSTKNGIGALYTGEYAPTGSVGDPKNLSRGLYIDTSRVVPTAAENRPHNIALIAQIKY